jgi:hypothetical protein
MAAMAIDVGTDYLWFETVDCSNQSLVAAMARGSLLLTPNLIAMLPVESVGSMFVANIATRFGDDPVGAVRELVDEPTMTVPDLEARLTQMFARSRTRWLFPIAELEIFKISTGFFGKITVKMPDESVRRIVIRDKGGKVAARDFYRAHPPRGAVSAG